MLFTCLYIFLARLIDVSIGTVRTILTVQGKRKMASILAFIEVMIWFYVAANALDNAGDSVLIPISYAGGFALGTFIGSYITSKYVDGYLGLWIITKNNNTKLINSLRKSGYGISIVDLKKTKDNIKKDLILIATKKKSLKEITLLVKKYDSNAFITVNETKYVQNGLVK